MVMRSLSEDQAKLLLMSEDSLHKVFRGFIDLVLLGSQDPILRQAAELTRNSIDIQDAMVSALKEQLNS